MAKYTIGEICEKLDILNHLLERLGGDNSMPFCENDYKMVEGLLREYEDILLGIKVDI